MAKKEYRFSIGNSNEGQLGMCFSVFAETEDEAVAAANRFRESGVNGIELNLDEVVAPVLYFGDSKPFTAADDLDDVFDVPENAS